MIEINGTVYRNLQEQVEKNKEDIEELQQSGITVDAYTKEESDAKFLTKSALTDYSINEIIVGNSQVDSDNVDLRAVYSQDVKSEVSLDPTSSIIRTMSGTDVSTIGISGTEIDVSTSLFKYNSNEVATKDDILEYESGDGILITTSGDHLRQISVSSDVAMKTDLVNYHAGTNVSFSQHSGIGAAGWDINVPIKTINGNSIAGTGDVSVAALTEDSFRVNVRTGNPATKTWYYTFRAEASLDTTLTGTTALYAYVPLGAILYCPDDNCLYSIVSIIPNSQTTIAKYDGTTTVYLTASFVNTTVERL